MKAEFRANSTISIILDRERILEYLDGEILSMASSWSLYVFVFLVPAFAGMFVSTFCFVFSIPRFPSRSNHYVKKARVYHDFLRCSQFPQCFRLVRNASIFANPCQPFEPYQTSLFLSLEIGWGYLEYHQQLDFCSFLRIKVFVFEPLSAPPVTLYVTR